jgi:hypothetical protein
MQHNDKGKEVACYYLSCTMVGAKHNYSPIKKLCLALIFALKKLRHYMLAHEIQLVARVDPIKYLLSQPALTGRLAKWVLLMIEFDLTFVPQKLSKDKLWRSSLRHILYPMTPHSSSSYPTRMSSPPRLRPHGSSTLMVPRGRKSPSTVPQDEGLEPGWCSRPLKEE